MNSSMSSSISNDFKLSSHDFIQKELEPYTELMKLLRALDLKAFTQLTKVYTKTMGTLYQRNFKLFFENAKDNLIANRFQHQQGASKYLKINQNYKCNQVTNYI